MHIPKIVFEPVPLEKNIEFVKWAYFQSDGSLDIHSNTINCFPELGNIGEDASEEEMYEIVEKVVTEVYNKNISKINSEILRYSEIWEKYSDLYFNNLSKYLNVEWPDKDICCNVGIMPVCPRYLDSFDFCISVDTPSDEVIRVFAHECCHFLWFEKIKELYPNIPRREYDSPYNAWKYSEMVVDPILNSKFINDIFNNKFNEKAYDSFYEIKDKDGKYLMDVLKDIYNSDKPIESKIREGFDYICSVLDN